MPTSSLAPALRLKAAWGALTMAALLAMAQAPAQFHWARRPGAATLTLALEPMAREQLEFSKKPTGIPHPIATQKEWES